MPNSEGKTLWRQAADLAAAIKNKNVASAAKRSLPYMLTAERAEPIGQEYSQLMTTIEIYHAKKQGRKPEELRKFVGRGKGPQMKIVKVNSLHVFEAAHPGNTPCLLLRWWSALVSRISLILVLTAAPEKANQLKEVRRQTAAEAELAPEMPGDLFEDHPPWSEWQRWLSQIQGHSMETLAGWKEAAAL